MTKNHIHVYKVIAKAEVDFETSDSVSLEQHQEEALQMAKDDKLQFKSSDCNFVSLGFHTDN